VFSHNQLVMVKRLFGGLGHAYCIGMLKLVIFSNVFTVVIQITCALSSSSSFSSSGKRTFWNKVSV